MLTGDNAAAAEHIATQLGIDEVLADLLPEHKVDAVRPCNEAVIESRWSATASTTPPHSRPPTSASPWASGAPKPPSKQPTSHSSPTTSPRSCSHGQSPRRTYHTIKENLFVGVGVVHVLGITAALIGLIGPVQAAIIHLGPDVLVFLNSTKLLRIHIDTAPMRANASAANAAWLTPVRGAPARCGGSDTPRW